MIRIIYLMLHGCWHRWRPTGRVRDHYDISFGHRSYMYRAHEVQCEKCGRYSMLKSKA